MKKLLLFSLAPAGGPLLPVAEPLKAACGPARELSPASVREGNP